MAIDERFSGEDAELLLYLADELDPEARVAFEFRLQRSAGLQGQLAEIRELDQTLSSAGSASATASFVSERALQSTLRAVREQFLIQNAQGVVARRFQLPSYAVAAGIAITMTLGFIGWLYTTSPVSIPTAKYSPVPPTAGGSGGQGYGMGVSSGFQYLGMDEYSDSSRQIDQEVDALSMLADLEGDPEVN